MKKFAIASGLVLVYLAGYFIFAADHVDAPAVGSLGAGSGTSDITDFYAFESPSNSDNYVFICNVQGLLAPGDASASASFDENVLFEFNIDNDGDVVEDLVIQCRVKGGKLQVWGPVAPSAPGLSSIIERTATMTETDVTAYQGTPSIGTNGGMSIFAGARDDPFFMDFFRFVDIVNGAGSFLGLDVPAPADGTAYATSFQTPGSDTFAGTNVMSVVVEVPKSMLGSSDTFNAWAESKRRL